MSDVWTAKQVREIVRDWLWSDYDCHDRGEAKELFTQDAKELLALSPLKELLALLAQAGGRKDRLAVLSEDEALPANHYVSLLPPHRQSDDWIIYDQAQQDMVKVGFRRMEKVTDASANSEL